MGDRLDQQVMALACGHSLHAKWPGVPSAWVSLGLSLGVGHRRRAPQRPQEGHWELRGATPHSLPTSGSISRWP